MYAYTNEDAQDISAEGGNDALFKDILNKYKILEDKCDFVLCEGTDFTEVTSAFEFDFNADVANNLGCPILVLVNGRGRSPEDVLEAVQMAQKSFENKGCTILAMIINRVDPEKIDTLAGKLEKTGLDQEPLFVLPEDPALDKPTVGDIVDALNAEIVQGEPEGLNREVHNFKVAAMNLPHFLDHNVAQQAAKFPKRPLKSLNLITLHLGIGENASFIRAGVCLGLSHLGIEVDPEKNNLRSKEAFEIQTASSPVKVLVIPTNEELQIAEETLATIKRNS